MLSKLKNKAIELLNRGIDAVQEKFPPNRIVVLLTPTVFVPIAGTVSAWIAENFPGMQLNEGAVVGFAGIAALSALTLAFKWLDRWQERERSIEVMAIDRTAKSE